MKLFRVWLRILRGLFNPVEARKARYDYLTAQTEEAERDAHSRMVAHGYSESD